MGLKKLGSNLGKMAAAVTMMANVEAHAENAAEQQVAATFKGVENCGVHLRELREQELAAGREHSRSHWVDLLADCRNAQLQATLDEQEAEIARLDARLAELNTELTSYGIMIDENRQILTLEGVLLGYIRAVEGEIVIDLSPLEQATEIAQAEYNAALARLEQTLQEDALT